MDPLTLQLLQMGIMGIGGIALGNRRDNSTQRLLDMIAAYTNPNRVLGDARQYYNAFLQSPAYSHGLSAVNIGANRAASDVASSLAYRGMTGSGVGAMLGAMGSNTAGFKLADLKAQGWMSALNTAQQIAQSRLQGAGYLKGPRDIGMDTGAGFLDWLGKIDVSKLPGVKSAPRPSNALAGDPMRGVHDSINQFAQLYQR